MQFPAALDRQRASLRHFEGLYARWSAAAEALAAAELRLWAETLRAPDSEGLRILGEEVLRLRALAQAARDAMPAADGTFGAPLMH